MTLSTQERTNISKLTVAMFNAAPGANYLAELGGAFEANGRNLLGLAKDLANTGAYLALNPVTQTAAQFAAAFLTPLGLAANAEAQAFVNLKFNAGVSKGQIAYDAAVALDASTAPTFADAKAILANKTLVADYYSSTLAVAGTSIAALQQSIAGVTQDAATVATATAALTPVPPAPPAPPAPGGATTINLTSANDTYTIGAGNFNINGLGGNDTITTGDGNNTVTTLGGDDTITTGAGNDTINGGDGNNTINAGGGTNTVTTGTGNDTITTGAGNDVIVSGAGNDIITAGAGSDIITSGAGNDSISLGVDSVVDTVIFAATAVTNGSDVITGFSTGIDKLNVHATTAQTATTPVAGALTVTAGQFYFLATGIAGNADSAVAAAAALQAAAAWTNGVTGAVAFFAINDDNSSAIYQYVEAGGAGITAGELTLMGTVDAKIATGDLSFT